MVESLTISVTDVAHVENWRAYEAKSHVILVGEDWPYIELVKYAAEPDVGIAGGDRGEGSATNPPDAKSEVRRRVDGVIGDLMNRDVDAQDRTRLGKALDTANAPDNSVKGQNSAVGRIASKG